MDEVEAEEEEEDIWMVWADGFSQGWDQVRRYFVWHLFLIVSFQQLNLYF